MSYSKRSRFTVNRDTRGLNRKPGAKKARPRWRRRAERVGKQFGDV